MHEKKDVYLMTSEKNLLVDADIYLKSGVHIGTKNKSGDMRRYIFKARQDGLSVLDVHTLDHRLRLAAKLLANYEPSRIAVVGRRLYAKTPVKKFVESVGGKDFCGRFVPGTFTNPTAKEFFEPQIVVITESEPDAQAIEEAKRIRAPVIAFSSTNNSIRNVDLVIPINNKGRRSLALAYWLLSKQTLLEKGIIKSDAEFTKTIDDFEYQIREEEKRAEERKKLVQKMERRRKGGKKKE